MRFLVVAHLSESEAKKLWKAARHYYRKRQRTQSKYSVVPWSQQAGRLSKMKSKQYSAETKLHKRTGKSVDHTDPKWTHHQDTEAPKSRMKRKLFGIKATRTGQRRDRLARRSMDRAISLGKSARDAESSGHKQTAKRIAVRANRASKAARRRDARTGWVRAVKWPHKKGDEWRKSWQ